MDLNLIKNKLAASQKPASSTEKTDFSTVLWKPKTAGKYQIRIVDSKYDPSNPFKEVFVHYGFSKFPIFALTNWGEKDPIVEFVKSLRQTKDNDNWKLSTKIQPKSRYFAPVVVRGEEEKGVRLWEFGREIYLDLLGIADDEDYGDFTDVAEGRDFTVDAVEGEVAGRKGIKCSVRVKPKTSPLSENPELVERWLNNQPNILDIQAKFKMDFEKLKDVLTKWLNPTEEEGDAEQAEPESEKEESLTVDSGKLPTDTEDTPPFEVNAPAKPTSKAGSKKKFEDLFKD